MVYTCKIIALCIQQGCPASEEEFSMDVAKFNELNIYTQGLESEHKLHCYQSQCLYVIYKVGR